MIFVCFAIRPVIGKIQPDGRIYLFTPGGLKEAAGNFGVARVLAAIEAAGAFTETGSGGKKAKMRRVPEGGTKRLYHIDVEKLRADLL